MANREACELYIEQEIKSALEDGKKPWTIGKELAAWIEKLFEVTINPRTIERRAERIEKKDTTNVVKKSKPIENIEEKETPAIIENRKPQGGGKRINAGRPATAAKIVYKNSKNHIVSKHFKDAFETLWSVVFTERAAAWKHTTKEAVLDHLNFLISELQK